MDVFLRRWFKKSKRPKFLLKESKKLLLKRFFQKVLFKVTKLLKSLKKFLKD